MKTLRELAIFTAKSYLGTPYIWGGDDPMRGFDCSGFICEILKTVGIIKENDDFTAQELFTNFPLIKNHLEAEAGDLVFYGNSVKEIKHVEMLIFIDNLNHAYSIGASGGGSKNNTLQDAINNNAFVKIRPVWTRKYPMIWFSKINY